MLVSSFLVPAFHSIRVNCNYNIFREMLRSHSDGYKDGRPDEGISISEALVNIYHITRCNIPEDKFLTTKVVSLSQQRLKTTHLACHPASGRHRTSHPQVVLGRHAFACRLEFRHNSGPPGQNPHPPEALNNSLCSLKETGHHKINFKWFELQILNHVPETE